MDFEEKPFLRECKDIIEGSFGAYLNLSQQIGDLVNQHAQMVREAVSKLYSLLILTGNHSKPDTGIFMQLLKPLSESIMAIQEFREKNRASSWFNHLSAISESIGALGWVTVSPTPAPFVKEMTDAATFYTNKVLVAYKEKDKTHIDWAKAWLQFLNDLQKYIRVHHTTGLTWNSRGTPATASAGAPSAGGPPPPPPPPPADLFADPMKSGPGGDDTRSALLKELNRGTEITKGLKKITADQQTHKNPALRSSGPAPYKAPSSTSQPVVKSVAPPKPPRFELEGKKWMIEYQSGKRDLTVSDTDMSQSVNIYKCKDCLVVIKGKVNSITVDSCTKLSLVFDDIVSVVEFVNCQNIQAQSMGAVPTVNIEKTDVVEVYLNAKSLTAEIVTAKSSSVNVSVPSANGDFVEHPIPEQFKSIFNGSVFKTEPADKAA
ncbi:adenylyl cyclase-associated protein 1-like [Panonychus citri]|uniref:adenylyl cyclase-associated protein 1-like n=1 Tax=Panonychus citri TaxID=50023 RepID=UPI0023072C68|nr:adenylyl cyclase-associated protein 1-like [Panonychus citri]